MNERSGLLCIGEINARNASELGSFLSIFQQLPLIVFAVGQESGGAASVVVAAAPAAGVVGFGRSEPAASAAAVFAASASARAVADADAVSAAVASWEGSAAGVRVDQQKRAAEDVAVAGHAAASGCARTAALFGEHSVVLDVTAAVDVVDAFVAVAGAVAVAVAVAGAVGFSLVIAGSGAAELASVADDVAADDVVDAVAENDHGVEDVDAVFVQAFASVAAPVVVVAAAAATAAVA